MTDGAAALRQARDAARAQRDALAEVLRAIAASPDDPQPVFDTILRRAVELCGAEQASISAFDGTTVSLLARIGHGSLPQDYAFYPRPAEPTDMHGRVALTGETTHLRTLDNPADPFNAEVAARLGTRSMLGVPLRRDGRAIGAIVLRRTVAGGFADAQVELVEAFAEQAAIAIGHARARREEREALARQTAMAEVLAVINANPGNLAPVFDTILEKSLLLCGSSFGTLNLWDGAQRRTVAVRGLPARFAAFLTESPSLGLGPTARRAVETCRTVQVVDVAASAAYRADDPMARSVVDLGDARTLLQVPLLSEGAAIGFFSVYRQEVRAFAEREIALLESFAAQAVIAIDNARLLTEQREALARQTAMAEVLATINANPGDLTPVFETILAKAHALCGAEMGAMKLFDGKDFRAVATHGYPERLDRAIRAPHGVNPLDRKLLDGAPLIAVDDLEALVRSEGMSWLGVHGRRSGIALPLRREDAVIGLISAFRHEVRPFSKPDIALLESFAAQAVIAIENARLLTEQREALARQTAMAEVLATINASPSDLAPVFDAMLEKAMRLCGISFGVLNTWDGRERRTVATRGLPPAMAEYYADNPVHDLPPAARLTISTRQPVQVPDIADSDNYRAGNPLVRALVALGRVATMLHVPLLKEDGAVGYFSFYRQEKRPFGERDITLLQSFAAQAVIALDNARLLTEQREALERQTATVEVLEVINRHPGELAPVFDAMLEKAMRLCGVAFGLLYTWDGKRRRAVALRGLPPAFAAYMAANPEIESLPPLALKVLERRRTLQIPDAAEGEGYLAGHASPRALVDLGGARTTLQVPLVKEDAVVGYFSVYRQEVRPFAEKEIALLESFAAQAVIAIENARLLTEQREALARQTAIAEVLATINANPGNLQPVFAAILERAHSVCGADGGALYIVEGDAFRTAATHGYPPDHAAIMLARPPFPPNRFIRRMIDTGEVIQLDDVARLADQLGEGFRADIAASGMRSGTGIPLLGNGVLLGFITAWRRTVQPFSPDAFALLESFAAQAVIAIENARLLTEQREALARQTAMSDLLRAINASPGALEPVFRLILDKAHRLCGASMGNLVLYEDGMLRAVATHGMPPAYADFVRAPFPPGGFQRRLLAGERLIHVPDMLAEPDDGHSAVSDAFRALTGLRTLLMIPLRKDAAFLGLISAFRTEVRPFDARDIALLENFAAQAVIAIENARLLTEQREALARQTAIAEVLATINANPGNLAPVFDAVLERAMRLCGVAYGSLYRFDGTHFHSAAHRGLPEAFVAFRSQGPIAPTPGSIADRLLTERRPVQTDDITADPIYRGGTDIDRAPGELGQVRAMLLVPLLREGEVVGHITLSRAEAVGFPQQQVALVEAFAAQAAVAMENARLLDELRTRTHQLDTQVAHQAATIDVLKAMAAASTDTDPVFDVILRRAMELCDSTGGALFTYDGTSMRVGRLIIDQPAEAIDAFLRLYPRPPGRVLVVDRAVLERRTVYARDLHAEPDMPADGLNAAIRSTLAVPLLRDGTAIGALSLTHGDVAGFDAAQVALVETFAEQAVIAMRSAATLRELAERNAEFAEQIAHQSATIDVLKVMAVSPGDPQPVFDLIATRARDVCGAYGVTVYEYDGALIHWRASTGLSDDPAVVERFRARFPAPATPDLIIGMTVLARDVVHIRDFDSDPRINQAVRGGIEARSAVGVPLLRDGRVIGVVVMGSRTVGGFPEPQVALLTTFAEQAVIAITSAETFRELQTRTEELAARNRAFEVQVAHQAATIDVLKVMSSATGDTGPVFETILDRALELCGGKFGGIVETDGRTVELRRVKGWDALHMRDYAKLYPRPFGTWRMDRAMSAGEVQLERDARPGLSRLDYVGQLSVPLMRDGAAIGCIAIGGEHEDSFNASHVALLTTFAEQAAIAIASAETFRELQARTEELAARNRAFEVQVAHQAATIDVLKVMSSATGDTGPVFDIILTRAFELSGCMAGGIYEYDGEMVSIAIARGFAADAFAAFSREYPRKPTAAIVAHRAMLEARTIYAPDITAEPDMPPSSLALGHRSALAVPLLRDGRAIGGFSLTHREVNGFTPAHVELIQTFAEQAVIAIGSVATFRSLQDRTGELALRNDAFAREVERQDAIIEVLRVMASTIGDVAPVFEVILRRALAFCGAHVGALVERVGDLVHLRSLIGIDRQRADDYKRLYPRPLSRDWRVDRVIIDGVPDYAPDINAKADPTRPAALRALELRSQVTMPLLRDGAAIGAIALVSNQPDAFDSSHMGLLATFAEQAVIAMASVANFRALQDRTAELTRSVAELQALEEVTRAVNASLDRDTVLATIIARAVDLGAGAEGTIYEYDEAADVFVPKANAGMTEARIAGLRDRRIRMGETHVGRAAALRAPVHVADVQNDPAIPEVATLLAGIHAVLAVPLLLGDRVAGGLVIRRRTGGAFAPSTVTLMQTFAAQSAIAMQNARLFDEVQARSAELAEALATQTATADVLKAISRSAFDLDTVLETLARSAATLCGADTAIMRIRSGDVFRVGAAFGLPPGFLEHVHMMRLEAGRGSMPGRVMLSRSVETIEDIMTDPDIDATIRRLSPNRAALGVPLLREGVLEGVFNLGRREPGHFTQRQIDLVQTFADHALIAIENARLFNEVQARTEELTRSLNDLRAAQDRLVQTEKLASLGQLTAGIAHEIKNPLNFVNNFAALSLELLDELDQALAAADASLRAEVGEVTGLLRGNLDRVIQHGRRADGIVRNMLLHSRERGGERRAVDFNATVEEALNLAYHGARAETPGFNITLARGYDPTIGAVELYPQEFTRVLLNLIGNGFYAATRRAAEPGFAPTLSVATEARADAVLVRVRDNGAGIPDHVRARLFEPFFTTKPAGEGTGLGLSLSHDIVVKQHGGTIAVATEPGAFTEFTVTIPRSPSGAAT